RKDRPEADEEDAAATGARAEVRLTAMVDEFCAASTDRAVDRETTAQPKKIQVLSDASTPRFADVDPLPGVPDDFASRGDRFLGEDAPAVDRRTRVPQLEMTETRAELG